MSKKKIMVVDDNVTNLNVARKALEDEYDVFPINSGEKALKILEKVNPHLILLDVEMPDMNGFDVIVKIKELGSPYDEIPIIFVTAKDDTSSEYEGLNLGAVDYVIKPFSFPLLLKRVEIHLKLASQQKELQNYSTNLETMVSDQIETIQKLQYAIVHVLADMVEQRDGSTGAHLIRTSEYLKILLKKAKELNVYEGELNDAPIQEYAQASQLHDIGKISIPDVILLKAGKLTDYEFQIMKTHTTVGEEAIKRAMDIIDDSAFLNVAADFIGAHHEKWNGTGYPRGLKGEDIPICGRLMAIVDVYDALISVRSYKPAFTHEQTIKIMYDGDGTHFDPVLMDVFRSVHLEFKEISDKYQDAVEISTGDLY
ncbi:MAG: response regulator [Clostridia bacterium]